MLMKAKLVCEIPGFRRLADGLLRAIYRALFTDAGGTTYGDISANEDNSFRNHIR